MTDELQIYRAVQATRRDMAEGLRLSDAATHAAKRYGVPVSTVTAYVQCATAGCKQAMADLSDDGRR